MSNSSRHNMRYDHVHACSDETCRHYQDEEAAATLAGSPLACLVYGFEEVFRYQWGYDYNGTPPQSG